MKINRRTFIAGSSMLFASSLTSQARGANQPLSMMIDSRSLYENIVQQGLDTLGTVDSGASIETIWTENYTDTLQKSLRNKIVGVSPTVALHAHNNIAMLAARGDIFPLDPFMPSAESGSSSPIGSFNGKQYGVPFSLSVPVVYVNCDLLGRPDSLPSTWDEIISNADAIDAPSGGAYFNYSTDGSWTFMALIESLGGRILNEDGTDIAFDTQEGLEAMEILGSFARVRKGAALSPSHARQAFAAGAIGIHIDTTSRLRYFEQHAEGNFKMAVVPFPIRNVPAARIPPSGGSLTIMASESQLQEHAWAMIAALMQPNVQSLILKETGFIPGAAVSGANSDLLPELEATPHFDAIEPLLAVLGPWVSFPVSNPARADKVVRDQLDFQASLQATPQDTLERIVREIRQM
ncbi:hypothetical protein C5748_10620 [Phyllobacterium phragmitis]|uniref:ABC transporter substrate-binding protein n=1 Tax=Phyllobacterium phragmitis TaxID=2670329 RepID=A0A2S9IT65_9HYPH|nr:extracellular solute-binding protein [Phyllobacterium phragmitis]PRD43691.1 hypothetical protein C5748_10620 [Phyllobacterium phragmitis]